MKKTITLLLLFVTLMGTAQDISFSDAELLFHHPMVNYNREANTENPLAVVDYNGDGLLDFIGNGESGIFSNNLYFLEAESATSFKRDSLSRGGAISSYAQALDFDGDGALDILFSDFIYFFDRKDRLTIPLPDTYDSFVTFDNYLGAEDFNGDGKFDILVRRIVSGDDNELAIYLSNPNDDTYENLIVHRGEDYADFTIKDINQDGILDLAVVELFDLSAIYIHIFYSDGNGNFTNQMVSAREYFFEANFFANLELTDMDGDEDLDLVYADDFVGITIIENTGVNDAGERIFPVPAFDYESPIQLPVPFQFEESASYAVEDMNKDDRPDLIVLTDRGSLFYAENQGSFTFSTPVLLAQTSEPDFIYSVDRNFDLAKLKHNLQVVDYDGDNDLDVLYLDGNSGEQWLLRSELLISNTNQVSNNHLVQAFPNPTSNNLMLSSDLFMEEVYLYSLNGELVSMTPINDKRLNMAMEHLSPGMYLLQIRGATYQTNLKIVVH